MANSYGKKSEVFDEDPEYFSAGFSHFGNTYSIGLNPDGESEFYYEKEDYEKRLTEFFLFKLITIYHPNNLNPLVCSFFENRILYRQKS